MDKRSGTIKHLQAIWKDLETRAAILLVISARGFPCLRVVQPDVRTQEFGQGVGLRRGGGLCVNSSSFMGVLQPAMCISATLASSKADRR
jgi:hypothetical protein